MQVQLLNQPRDQQGLGEGSAADHQQWPPGALLQRVDLADHVTTDHAGVGPVGAATYLAGIEAEWVVVVSAERPALVATLLSAG